MPTLPLFPADFRPTGVLPTKWDLRFLALAREVASWSKDPSTRVGAVISDPDNRVVSLGFNGFPRGLADDNRLAHREVKYELTVHAEVNAIMFAGRPLAGCTLHVWPIAPCARCAAQIIQAGITRVVRPLVLIDRWVESCETADKMFEEAGVHRIVCNG